LNLLDIARGGSIIPTIRFKFEQLLIGVGDSGESDAERSEAGKLKGGSPVEAYCLKCRTQREMKDAKPVTMKNGKPATKGVCPVCGTGMYKIGKAK
jgi:hypothetical protein